MRILRHKYVNKGIGLDGTPLKHQGVTVGHNSVSNTVSRLQKPITPLFFISQLEQ